MTLDTATNQALRERFNPEGSQLRAVQMRMLGMLKQLDSLCREHNIKWWLSSGSCLGAMRHGGFIPWDDDLDIEMEYPDYKRLIRLLRQGAIPGFALQDRKSDPEYMLTFPKWRDLHSRIEEQSVQDRRWKFQGVYIDIFPMLPSGSLRLHKRALNAHNILLRRPTRIESRPTRRFMLKTGGALFYGLIDPLCRLLGRLGAGERRRHLPGSAFHYDRDARDFRQVVYVDFEDTKMPVPADADAYLTRIYGDWRRVPAPDQIETHIQTVTLDPESSSN